MTGFWWKGESYKTLGAAFFRDAPSCAGDPGSGQRVAVSTCNRREVFCYGEIGADARGSGHEALAYLFRIAAGLESMVLGEYQILGQVRDAYRAACAAGLVGKELDRIFRDAIACAKKVKTRLDIGAVPPSVCRAGMEIVDRDFGFADRRVFVIGSGRTGTLAAETAVAKGARSVAVCNRSPERARRLADLLGAETVPYESRYEKMADCDIVVSATASPHTVVEAARLVAPRPAVFLDLAMPRDVEHAVAELPGVSVVGLEEIGELAAGEREERGRLVAEGVRIVEESVGRTEEWLDAL